MKRTPSFRWLLPVTLAAGLVVSFYDVVFLDRTLQTANYVPGTSTTGIGSYGYTGDRYRARTVLDAAGSGFSHDPEAHAARRMVWRGEMPLWNPHVAGGMPFLAEMAPAILFPLQWVLLISDASRAWDAYMLLRLLVAGIGTGLYLRSMGLGRLSSLFGGYAYMLCGAHMALINVVHMNAAALFPFLLYCAERVARSPSRGPIVWLGIVVGLEVLAGTAEAAAFALIYAAAYFVFRVFTLPERRALLVRRLRGGAIAVIVGLALSAPLWIPFLEFLGASYHVHPRGVGLRSLPLPSASLIVAPEVLGPMWEHWDGSHPMSDPGYAGTIVCLLALLAVVRGAALRSPWSFFAGAAVFSILKIYGLPGFNTIVGNLPIFDRSYVSVFLGSPLFLSLAVLAGVALDRITGGDGGGLRAASAGMIGLLWLIVWIYLPEAETRSAIPALLGGILPAGLLALVALALGEACRRGLLTGGIVAGCLLGLLVVDLFIPIPRTRHDRHDLFEEPPYVKFLKDRGSEGPFRVIGTAGILHPNWACAHELDDVAGYTPLFVGRYVDWMRRVMGVTETSIYALNDTLIPSLDVDGADLLNLKFVIEPTSGAADLTPGPRSEVMPGRVPRGEILPGQEVGQTFLCTGDRLSAIGVDLALYARKNRGTLEFRLYEGEPGGEPIRVARARMERVRGGVPHVFRFDPVEGSAGRMYAFTLSSPDASGGNAVTVWMHPVGRYAQGHRLEDRRALEGDLGFGIFFAPAGSRYHLVYDDEVKIFENRRCLPRAYLVAEGRRVPDREGVFAAMEDPAFDPRRAVLLEGEGEEAPAPGETWRADGSRATITGYGPNRVVVSVESGSGGYLVLLDNFFTGWTARVDGERRPILPAYGLFRAVRVRPGEEQVEFVYRPATFGVGLGLALACILCAAAVLIVGGLRERREAARRPL